MDTEIVFRVTFRRELNEAEIDEVLSKFIMEFVEPRALRYGGGIREEKIEGAISKDLTNEISVKTVGSDLSIFWCQFDFVETVVWKLYSEVDDAVWFGGFREDALE